MDTGPFRRATVGIVGGSGRMGSWLGDMLQGRGYKVLRADLGGNAADRYFAEQCRVIILAVPVSAVEAVMAQLGPHTRPDGLVMDICSLKASPMASMEKHARGSVVGAHPLCGPGADSLEGQTVFLCHKNAGPWLEWAKALWAGLGAEVVESDPHEHDRLMAKVQTLRHLLLCCLGGALDDLGFQPQMELPVAGPWFRSLVEMLAHQAEQPADLYTDLALHNPHGLEAAGALERNVAQAARSLRGGDRGLLMDLMAKAGRLAEQARSVA